jgi:ribosomal protein S18 acetylase RimI-like enzyme
MESESSMSMDDLQIKSLSPDMANQFTSYLSEMDFSHAEHWHFCYCQYYHIDCSSAAWRQRTAEQNKALAVQNIESGLMRGLVALAGEQMVGWVNVNDVNNYALLKRDEELQKFPGRSAMVVCFVIHPEYRGKGLANKMLAEAVEISRQEGFDRIIGRPFLWSAHPLRQYHGLPKMFEDLGFKEVSETNGVHTYVLELK